MQSPATTSRATANATAPSTAAAPLAGTTASRWPAYEKASARETHERHKLYMALFVSTILITLVLLFYMNQDILMIWGFRAGLPIVLGYRFPSLAGLIPGLPARRPADYAYGVYVATRLGGDPRIRSMFADDTDAFTLHSYAQVGELMSEGETLCNALETVGIRKSPAANKAMEGLNIGLQAVGTAIQFAVGDIPGALLSLSMLAPQIPSAIRIFREDCLSQPA